MAPARRIILLPKAIAKAIAKFYSQAMIRDCVISLAVLPGVSLLPPASAQQSGRMTGVVTDPTGSPIPDVSIEATRAGTGDRRAVSTNDSGVYVLSPLAPGDYNLEVRREGFKADARTVSRIGVNAALTVDLRLEVGGLSERITVEATAAAIETESQAIGNSCYQVQLKNSDVGKPRRGCTQP